MNDTIYLLPLKDSVCIGPHTSECINSSTLVDLITLSEWNGWRDILPLAHTPMSPEISWPFSHHWDMMDENELPKSFLHHPELKIHLCHPKHEHDPTTANLVLSSCEFNTLTCLLQIWQIWFVLTISLQNMWQSTLWTVRSVDNPDQISASTTMEESSLEQCSNQCHNKWAQGCTCNKP